MRCKKWKLSNPSAGITNSHHHAQFLCGPWDTNQILIFAVGILLMASYGPLSHDVVEMNPGEVDLV